MANTPWNRRSHPDRFTKREFVNWLGMLVGIVAIWTVIVGTLLFASVYALGILAEAVAEAGGPRPLVEQLWCGSTGCLGDGS